MQTYKEMDEQAKQIFIRLFGDVKEIAQAGKQGNEVYMAYIKSKVETLTLEEQELCLTFMFSTKLDQMLITFARLVGVFKDSSES